MRPFQVVYGNIDMIIIKLIGGLGNQMFQYALGRSLSIINNIEFKIDISSFEEDYKLHKYGLDKFKIVEQIATRQEINESKNPKGINKLINNADFLKPYYRRRWVKEQSFPFDQNILKIDQNAYIEGHWASEKYFKSVDKIIRTDLCIKEKPDEENASIAKEITNSESVSIHIRRGDYIDNPQTNKIHGTCSLDYYHLAIEDIAKKVKNPHFFVFSNDYEWVKKNLTIPYPMRLVSINGADKNYEDIRLMSLCKHHIIANSTFSWWGAWLSENENKQIYSPKIWYNIDYNIKDLLPDSWIKI